MLVVPEGPHRNLDLPLDRRISYTPDPHREVVDSVHVWHIYRGGVPPLASVVHVYAHAGIHHDHVKLNVAPIVRRPPPPVDALGDHGDELNLGRRFSRVRLSCLASNITGDEGNMQSGVLAMCAAPWTCICERSSGPPRRCGAESSVERCRPEGECWRVEGRW